MRQGCGTPSEEREERRRACSMEEATILALGAQLTSGPWADALLICPQCPSQGLACSQPTLDQKVFLPPSRVGVSLACSAGG